MSGRRHRARLRRRAERLPGARRTAPCARRRTAGSPGTTAWAFRRRVSDAGEPDAPLAAAFNGTRTGLAVTSGGVDLPHAPTAPRNWKVVSRRPSGPASGHVGERTVAYAGGDGGTVLRTLDGGATWSLLPSVPVDLGPIRCPTVLDCVDRSRRRAGAAAHRATAESPTRRLRAGVRRLFAAAFASMSDLVAAGESGATAVSDDGGQTWSRLGSELPMSFSRVRAFGDDFAVAAGRAGALAFSSDGGRTWTRDNSPTQDEVIDLVVPRPVARPPARRRRSGLPDARRQAWERLRTGGALYPQARARAEPRRRGPGRAEGDVAIDRRGRLLPARQRPPRAALEAVRRRPAPAAGCSPTGRR